MALGRQSICHPTESGFLGTYDLFVDAALAWVKERSRAH